jgi:hypothetical protein
VPELSAEPLSAIDAATLWPQMRRLSTEVVSTRAGENLLVASGLAATGLTRLPPLPRTIVLGVRRGLSYRGVLLARELSGGAAWEAVSLRIARDKDDETVSALVEAAGPEVARRDGRALLMRVAEGSPHAGAIRRGGMMAIRLERCYAVRRRRSDGANGNGFRPATRADRHAVFRLYCRAVPEHVRRQEAPTSQDWRAVLDSYDVEREFVVDSPRGIIAWVAFAERECRILIDSAVEGIADAALDLAESHASRHSTLVLGEDQIDLERRAVETRSYPELGVRLVYSRRLAALNPLKEVAPVPAELAVPQST